MAAGWSDTELSVLYALVNREDWFAQASEALPSRTPAALRARMGQLRAEAEIIPGHHGAVNEYKARKANAKQGSDRLLAAMLEMHGRRRKEPTLHRAMRKITLELVGGGVR